MTKPSSSASWWWLLLPFILVGVFYILSGLEIKAVQVADANFVNRDEMLQYYEEQKSQPAWLLFKQTNWLLFNSSALADTLNNNFQFESLKIRKDIAKLSIKIDFVEKEYNLVWQEGESNYYINYQGDIIMTEPIDKDLLADILIVTNESPAKKEGRSIVVDEKYLRFATALNDALDAKTKGLSNRRITIGTEFNTVKLVMLNGPVIYFSTDMDINDQINKLEALRLSELSDGQVFNSQKYIDLRYGKTIYYQ